jgi:hypothetical protein
VLCGSVDERRAGEYMAEVRTSSQCERPCAGIEVCRTAPGDAGGSKDPGQRKVHSLIDKVYARSDRLLPPLVRQRSGAFCSDPVPEYLAPIRLLAPLRSDLRLRLYPPLPSGASGRALRCLFLALSSASVALFQPYLPDGRYQASLGHWRSSPPCRPHTPWCDGVEPLCLRPPSAGSTIPRLRPTGSSLGIAPVDYDPVVLLKPFGPRLAAGALPSRASSMVAPGRPIRLPAFAVVPH